MQDQAFVVRRRRGHFFITENAAIDLVRIAGPMAFCVYCALLRYTTGLYECKPSIGHLATLLGVERTTIWRHIRRLVSVGALVVEHRPGHTSIYTVVDPSDTPDGAFEARSCDPETQSPHESATLMHSDATREATDHAQRCNPDDTQMQRGIAELQGRSLQECNDSGIAELQYRTSIKTSTYKDTLIKTARKRACEREDVAVRDGPTAKIDTLFEEFWSLYPRKVGKRAAYRIWCRLKPNDITFAAIKEALRWQRSTEQWRSHNGRFIPHPATWLNQARWLDEPTVTQELRENVEQIAERLRRLGLCEQ